MKVRAYALIILLAVFSSTYADDPAKAPEESTSEPPDKLTPEQLKLLYKYMAREKRGFVIPPKTTMPWEDRPKFTGDWIERDGVRTCDGYLTQIENEDYCEAEVPADWLPFEFDGRTYFVQPLADKSR